MKHYIAQLRAESERIERERREAQRIAQSGGDTRILCNTPLTDQIEALMRSLPPAQRNRLWSMDELCARLQGRYHPRPSAGDVGVALRRLGWTRIRDWSQDGEGRRTWQRPGSARV